MEVPPCLSRYSQKILLCYHQSSCIIHQLGLHILLVCCISLDKTSNIWFYLAFLSFTLVYVLYILLNVGQSRRHLIRNGWSRFVSAKKLVAGDTLIFVRLLCSPSNVLGEIHMLQVVCLTAKLIFIEEKIMNYMLLFAVQKNNKPAHQHLSYQATTCNTACCLMPTMLFPLGQCSPFTTALGKLVFPFRMAFENVVILSGK